MDDSRVIRELARDGTRHAFGIVKLLIEHGASKSQVIRSSAFYGNVVFLEKICEQGWHDYEGSWDDIMTQAAEGSQLDVIRWIDLPLGYFTNHNMLDIAETLDLAMSWSITHDDVAIFEYLWTKMERSDQWKKNICYEAVSEWSVNILEHMMLGKLSREDVMREVEERMNYSEPFEFYDDAKKWIDKQRTSFDVSSCIKGVMSLIDEIRDQIPEGHYLKISNQLLKAYKR